MKGVMRGSHSHLFAPEMVCYKKSIKLPGECHGDFTRSSGPYLISSITHKHEDDVFEHSMLITYAYA